MISKQYILPSLFYVTIIIIMVQISLGKSAIINLSSSCGKYNCAINCNVSISKDNTELLRQNKASMFHIVTMDIRDGRTETCSLDMSNYSEELLARFFSYIPGGSLLIMMSQGCYKLPLKLKSKISKYNRKIKKFHNYSRHNIFVSCIGRCSLKKSITISSDSLVFDKRIFINVTDQIIARMTTTTNKPLISSTTTSKSDVHLHLNANVILLAFTCVGILLLFTVTVLIYLCFTKTSPNSKNSDCWGRTRSVSNYPRRKQLVHNNITKLGFNDNLLYDVVNAGTTS